MAEPMSVIAIVITVSAVIVNVIAQNTRDARKNYDKRIDAKLDKEEYRHEQDAFCKRIAKCEDVSNTLLNIERAIASQGTDIDWIKKGLAGLTNQNPPKVRKPRLN